MAKMEESLISWNLPNFISFVFFIAILWVIIGAAGHLFIRRPAMMKARAAPAAAAASAAPTDYEDQSYSESGSTEPGP